jgi:hypothetical protein
VQSPFRFYEGTTIIKGTVNGVKVKGKGFVELLHSYSKPDLVFVNDPVWSTSKPIKWKVNNPDDGNPLKYDLEYSTDDQKIFKLIISDISDTFYQWNSKTIADNKKVWLRLTGKSVDGTLKRAVVKEFFLIPDK